MSIIIIINTKITSLRMMMVIAERTGEKSQIAALIAGWSSPSMDYGVSLIVVAVGRGEAFEKKGDIS